MTFSMNPFHRKKLEYDDELEPIYDNRPFGAREDRASETQREFFYKNLQLTYSESHDKSDQLLMRRIERLRGAGIQISLDESIEDFLLRGETELLRRENAIETKGDD